MSAKQRIEDFLAKAEEADEMAENAKDEFIRKQWQRAAKSFRDLARAQGY